MGTKNQQTTSTQSPPSWVSDAYKGIFNTVGQLGNSSYQPYTGGYYADQQQAFGNIRSLWGASDRPSAGQSGVPDRHGADIPDDEQLDVALRR